MYSKEIYNSIPVFYCKHCLSLLIRDVEGIPDTEYCDKCNSTNVGQTDIFTWEKLFEDKYGFKHLNNR